MKAFWERVDPEAPDWIKISLVKLPCSTGSVYHLAVLDDWSSKPIVQRDYDSFTEAVKAFEALCLARELLQPGVAA